MAAQEEVAASGVERDEEEPAHKRHRAQPCPACLGVLQDAYMMPRYVRPVLRMKFWYGSGSADPYLLLMDPDPAIFVSDLQDVNKNLIFSLSFFVYYGTF
jgi:hypothetical protein